MIFIKRFCEYEDDCPFKDEDCSPKDCSYYPLKQSRLDEEDTEGTATNIRRIK